jgi:hypothetical protein
MTFQDCSLYALPPRAYDTSHDICFIANSLNTSRMNLFSQFDAGFTEKARINLEFHPSVMFLQWAAIPTPIP